MARSILEAPLHGGCLGALPATYPSPTAHDAHQVSRLAKLVHTKNIPVSLFWQSPNPAKPKILARIRDLCGKKHMSSPPVLQGFSSHPRTPSLLKKLCLAENTTKKQDSHKPLSQSKQGHALRYSDSSTRSYTSDICLNQNTYHC